MAPRGKKGFQKKGRLAFSIALTVVCFILYHVLDAAEQRDEWRKAFIANLTAAGSHRLGRFCDSAGNCFIVTQEYWMDDSPRLHADRLVVNEQHETMALTVAHLQVPEIIAPQHLVHEGWRVDYSPHSCTYRHPDIHSLVQIATGFALEGLSFNRSTLQQKQRVLQIGIGGTATGYLAAMPLPLYVDVVELEPAVYEAAKRWLDFPQSPNIVVHIQDGVVFLKEAAAKGITYDSLILDAYSNSFERPHPLFLEEDVLAAMSKVIGTRGVLSVNLFMPRDQLRLQEGVIALFAAHFRSCSALVIASHGQKFLMCTNRAARFDWTHHDHRILRNLLDFDAAMGTNVAAFLDKLNPEA